MTDTKTLIEKYGIRANKSLGQNFLHRTDIINSIADAAKGTDTALEIGAGLGVLTKALCDRFSKVITVEIDRSLEKVTADSLNGVTNHTMVYADFLRLDLDTLPQEDITVVGNLPYNITGEIISKLLKNRSRFKRAVIMIQKEAAEKLASPVGQRSYRAISVLTQFYADITPLCDVSPDSFVPAPNVWSRVLILDFKDKEYDSGFSEFVYRVFSQRRKQLMSVIKDPDKKHKLKTYLETHGYSDTVRAEEIDADSLYELYSEIK